MKYYEYPKISDVFSRFCLVGLPHTDLTSRGDDDRVTDAFICVDLFHVFCTQLACEEVRFNCISSKRPTLWRTANSKNCLVGLFSDKQPFVVFKIAGFSIMTLWKWRLVGCFCVEMLCFSWSWATFDFRDHWMVVGLPTFECWQGQKNPPFWMIVVYHSFKRPSWWICFLCFFVCLWYPRLIGHVTHFHHNLLGDWKNNTHMRIE